MISLNRRFHGGPADRLMAAHLFIERTLARQGGLKSLWIRRKARRCASRQQLRALLPSFGALMHRRHGPLTAETCIAEVQKLLG